MITTELAPRPLEQVDVNPRDGAADYHECSGCRACRRLVDAAGQVCRECLLEVA